MSSRVATRLLAAVVIVATLALLSTLPLERYRQFTAPVLAYSFGDDAWGTARSVAAMMRAYPNVELRHAEPAGFGLDRIGHLGFFRPGSEALWRDAISWIDDRFEGEGSGWAR